MNNNYQPLGRYTRQQVTRMFGKDKVPTKKNPYTIVDGPDLVIRIELSRFKSTNGLSLFDFVVVSQEVKQ